MSFQFKKLEIPDVILIEPKVFDDDRGFFLESYKKTDFLDFGIMSDFVQDNHSMSKDKGVLRGLHYQKDPKSQAKLIRVISGSIFDVAVDIRKNSPFYGKWVGHELSAVNKKILYIPQGFAHGFCTLEENTEMAYKCTNDYSHECDRGIIYNDKDMNIQWPVKNHILSERDKLWPMLKEADNNFIYE